jgi:outer membrane protein OmpA-like peptidoglycan-associated protein
MRFTLFLLIVITSVAALFVLDADYTNVHKARLQTEAEAKLAENGLPGLKVELNYFDALLTGLVKSPADRLKAGDIVRSIKPLRVYDHENKIRITPQLTAKITGNTIKLTGWLSSAEVRAAVTLGVKEYRPELVQDITDLQVSPRVEPGEQVKLGYDMTWKGVVDMLNGIRVPPSLKIRREGDKFVLTGHVKTQALRDLIADAAQSNTGGWQVDATGLAANRNVNDASFSTGTALADFVRSFFTSPSPGEFTIDIRNGPYIKAYATPAMEAEWLALLRPITGAAKVKADISRVPSAYHFPDYKRTSIIPDALQPALKSVLSRAVVRFDFGSSELRQDEVVKLGPVVPLLAAAGERAKFIVAAYADPAGEPGADTQAIQRARAVAVHNRLVQMGVSPQSMEMMVFDKLSPPGALTDDVRFDCRKVELLIK